MDWKDFFKQHGDKPVMCYGGIGFTVEDMFTAFKERTKDERLMKLPKEETKKGT